MSNEIKAFLKYNMERKWHVRLHWCSLYRSRRPTGDVDARVHMYIAMALGQGGVATPMFDPFTPRKRPLYSFYRRLSGPQEQSGHEGVKKNLHPSNTRDQTQAFQHVAKHLAA